MSDTSHISIRQGADGALTWALTYPAGTSDDSIATLVRQAEHGVTLVATTLAVPAGNKPAPGERITGAQIELVYRLARKAPGGDEAVRATVAAAYGRAISDLDKTQASAVIAWLKGEGPAPVPAIPPAAPGTARQEVEDAAAVAAGRPASAPLFPDEDLFPAENGAPPPAAPTLAALRARVQRGMELQGWVPAQQINWLAGLFGDRKRDVTMLSGAELQQALDTLIAIHKARPAAASGKGATR